MFWKWPVIALLLNFNVMCTPVRSNITPTSTEITLLIVNQGITPITIRNMMGKLAWVFPSEKKCVILRDFNNTQTLQAQIGRSNFSIYSINFNPSMSPGWVWIVNEFSLIFSATSLTALSPPCQIK